MMSYFPKFKYDILLYCFIICLFSKSVQADRNRLPDEINRTQPILVPVVDPEATRIYFDRQNHPNNTGGSKDNDDIWFSNKLNDSIWSEAINAGNTVNTDSSDVLFTITPDGFSALIYSSGKENQSQPFALYRINNNKFKFERSIEIPGFQNRSRNFFGYLCADERTALFAINSSNSIGGLDIYVTFYNDDTDSWSPLKNLGKDINSKGLEGAPFLAYDMQTLYFISDSKSDSGDANIYISRRLDDSWLSWTKPQALGIPFNTNANEGGIWLSHLADSAYFISYDTLTNRQGIYTAQLPHEFKPYPYVIFHGVIEAEAPVATVTIENTDKNQIYFQKSYTPLQVFTKNTIIPFASALTAGYSYRFTISAPGYQDTVLYFSLSGVQKPEYYGLELDLTELIRNDEKVTVLFDFDEYELGAEAISLLDRLVERIILKKNQRLRISGHTDKSGLKKYNDILSIKRINSVINYLKKKLGKNISYSTRGYGSSQAISEDDSLNRRVEIEFD